VDGLFEEEAHAFHGCRAVVAGGRAGAGVVQVHHRVEAQRFGLQDVRGQGGGQPGAVGFAHRPVVEVARPVLVGEAERSDHRQPWVDGDGVQRSGQRGEGAFNQPYAVR
jgi:hypothetical protein